ncbi:MAG: undecaprenyl-phosphate glucose phosphotransferase [Burkholderiales bacterium]
MSRNPPASPPVQELWHTAGDGRAGRGLVGPQPNAATLVQVAVDPLVTVGALLACVAALGVRFSGAYLILCLIVFSLTFPGSAPKATSARAIAGKVLVDWFALAALLLLLGWVTRTLGVIDPRVAVAWLLVTPVLRFAAQLTMPFLLPRIFSAEGMRRTAVVAGGGGIGLELAERIGRAPHLGIRVAGFFDDRGPQRAVAPETGGILGPLAALPQYLKTHRVDIIYITLPMASQPRLLELLDALHDTTASIYFVPDIFVFDLIQARLDSIGGMPVVAVCDSPFHGLNGLVKRASDMVLATAILLLIAPLMAAIAIGVKATSPGPVLFRQRRYGLDGREILVYKFRSMTVAEDGDVIPQARREDRRVTPFGAFLRRYSLDELPQFVNVLQGRMSVVGPRPHAVAHNELYRGLIKGYMIRHKVRPGITGWAQVNGLRGETAVLEKMKRRIEFDLAYLRGWSLQLDLWIVLKTLLVIFKEPNAY